jgi:hypothetical protein
LIHASDRYVFACTGKPADSVRIAGGGAIKKVKADDDGSPYEVKWQTTKGLLNMIMRRSRELGAHDVATHVALMLGKAIAL